MLVQAYRKTRAFHTKSVKEKLQIRDFFHSEKQSASGNQAVTSHEFRCGLPREGGAEIGVHRLCSNETFEPVTKYARTCSTAILGAAGAQSRGLIPGCRVASRLTQANPGQGGGSAARRGRITEEQSGRFRRARFWASARLPRWSARVGARRSSGRKLRSWP